MVLAVFLLELLDSLLSMVDTLNQWVVGQVTREVSQVTLVNHTQVNKASTQWGKEVTQVAPLRHIHPMEQDCHHHMPHLVGDMVLPIWADMEVMGAITNHISKRNIRNMADLRHPRHQVVPRMKVGNTFQSMSANG